MRIKNLVLILLCLLCMNIFCSCDKTIAIRYESVDCIVVDKTYQAAWLQYTHGTGLRHHPSKYYVTVENSELNLKYTFNDSYLYNSVEENETIKMCVKYTTKESGKLKLKLVPYDEKLIVN